MWSQKVFRQSVHGVTPNPGHIWGSDRYAGDLWIKKEKRKSKLQWTVNFCCALEYLSLEFAQGVHCQSWERGAGDGARWWCSILQDPLWGQVAARSVGLSLTLCSCPKSAVLQVKWTPAKPVGKNTSGSVFRISCSVWQLPKSRANELYKTHRKLFRVKSVHVFSGKPCICRHLIVKGELYNRLKEVRVCTHPAGRRACKTGKITESQNF